MLKILQARLQQYMNCDLPDVQAGFRKGRGTRDLIAIILGIIFWAPKSLQMVTAAMKLKDAYSLEENL